jgi:FKBP-type peptidyl-prolyl cis-trans isomerase FkpA
MTRMLGRNDPCVCGSNKKFKKCCMNKPGFDLEKMIEEVKKRQEAIGGDFQIEDHEVGAGEEAVAGKTVSVHYTGWLYDESKEGNKGTKFDSSVDRGSPFEFALGAGMVIAGWDQGFAGMKVGGKRTLIIPSEMGYGEHGAGGAIPPNATLTFDVELLAVK